MNNGVALFSKDTLGLIGQSFDADEPGPVPLHRIDLLDAVQGDAPVDVGANPLLRRPILAHLLLADGHGLLVSNDDTELGPQDRAAELEADPVARHVLIEMIGSLDESA